MDQVKGSDIPLSVEATFYGPGKLVATAYNNIILLKYDTADNTISEESVLDFSPNISVKDGQKVSEFYFTRADIWR